MANVKCPRVIVRAHGDEPAILYALSRETGNRVRVAGRPEARFSMCLPQEQVISYDPDLFRELLEAYEKGDSGGLRRKWEQANKDLAGVWA